MLKITLATSLILSQLALADVTPTRRSYQSLNFTDDMSFENLDLAIERQLKVFNNRKPTGTIKFGTKSYPKSVLKDSLLLLRTLTAEARQCLKNFSEVQCQNSFNAAVNDQFAVYVPVPNKGSANSKNTTQFTSYYSPDLHGSRVPTERFKRPIYRKPDIASQQNHTRVDIDYRGALAGKGYEYLLGGRIFL